MLLHFIWAMASTNRINKKRATRESRPFLLSYAFLSRFRLHLAAQPLIEAIQELLGVEVLLLAADEQR